MFILPKHKRFVKVSETLWLVFCLCYTYLQMKQNYFRGLVAVLACLGLLLHASPASAGVHSAYFVAPEEVTVGQTITVRVVAHLSKDRFSNCFAKGVISSSKNLEVVSAVANTYPAKLTISTSAHAVDISAEHCDEGFSGTFTVLTITYLAVVPGTASITSNSWRTNDIQLNGTVANLSPVYVTVIGGKCPEGYVGTTPNCTPEEAESPDTNTYIQGVKLNNTIRTVTVTWITNHPVTETSLVYQKPGSNAPQTAEITQTNNTNFSATLPWLDPYDAYTFDITATNKDGKKISYSGTATTKGYPVKITVTQNNQPAANATVVIDDYSYTTAADGTFEAEMPDGRTALRISKDGATALDSIFVEKLEPKKDDSVDTQTFQLTLPTDTTAAGSSVPWLAIILGFLVLAAVGGGVYGWFFVKKRLKAPVATPKQ